MVHFIAMTLIMLYCFMTMLRFGINEEANSYSSMWGLHYILIPLVGLMIGFIVSVIYGFITMPVVMLAN